MDYDKLEELLHVKGEVAVTLAMHDLTHALGSEMLELMLTHAKEVEELEEEHKPKATKIIVVEG